MRLQAERRHMRATVARETFVAFAIRRVLPCVAAGERGFERARHHVLHFRVANDPRRTRSRFIRALFLLWGSGPN